MKREVRNAKKTDTAAKKRNVDVKPVNSQTDPGGIAFLRELDA